MYMHTLCGLNKMNKVHNNIYTVIFKEEKEDARTTQEEQGRS